MKNEMILASAGSGKTWQLTNRYIAIMARDLLAGIEPKPERILAVTFTRKAAGEFFDEILKKLAKGASSEEAAASLAGVPDEIQNPLYEVLSQLRKAHYRQLLLIFIQRMPRLFLGTLDSLFANIVRTFPAEFGLSGDFDILDEHQASLARNEVFRRVFELSSEAGEESDFLEAFRLATFGREEASVQYLLDQFITKHHDIFLSAASPALWGNPDRIWPTGTAWLSARGSHDDDFTELFEVFATEKVTEKQMMFWEEFRTQLLSHSPGNSLPKRVDFFLTKFLGAWDEINAGEAEFAVNRSKQKLGAKSCKIIRELTIRIVGDELKNHLTRTRGLWALLHQFEETYAKQVRRRGHLTFHDLEVILAGSPDSPAPILTQQPDEDSRLRIDYRLDATFHHWLLDEFQDTSYLQWSVIENLVDEAMQDQSADRSLFQVGDIKQAIYGWRGGDTRLFDDIYARYQGDEITSLKKRELSVSFRSGLDVIEPLNDIFGDKAALANLELPPAALGRWHWAHHKVAEANLEKPGLTAFYQPEGNDPTESCYELTLAILEEIQPIANGLSCVILVQDNKAGREVVNYIRAHSPSRIPVVSESDIAIAMDNPVTLAFLSLFQLAAHPGDDFAKGHLEISPLAKVMASQKLSTGDLSKRILTQVHREGFESTLRHWVEATEELNLLDDAFSKQRLQELALAARIFDQSGELSIDRFLLFARSYTLREPNSSSAVQVMTIHKSKGLTFDMAILPQLGGDSLSNPRRAIGVKRSPVDRSVQWVFDTPRKAITEADETLRNYLTELEAEAGYEELCKFYVALTRARYANYLIAPVQGPKSRKKNFIKLLEDTLEQEDAPKKSLGDVSFNVAYESSCPHTREDWWKHLQKKEEPDEIPIIEPERPTPTPRPRPARRTPSRKADWSNARQLFSRQESSALELGTAVHSLFKQIQWWQPGFELPAGTDYPREALQQVEGTLSDPACQLALKQPSSPAKVWREQDFEVLLDDHWTSGTFDRVTLHSDSTGKVVAAEVLDFKTDQVETEQDAQDRASKYRDQMDTYRAAAALLFGLPTAQVKTQLLFTRVPCLVEL
ncbi:UvrD-helicase domain-containing protein [Roseibacillus persicicus]|uniref:UvrD-helicase domain-containing protein n=1 Tax=Roseibacillus persicicus TaxID=454148 RepID=UPI00280DD5DB|nr:UvrD-helicase domain-containing protein [Roseibacillus persicicus]MDQ8189432.1 UvrD-helicase domain-containing protein [Roseibacillus persicicus]